MVGTSERDDRAEWERERVAQEPMLRLSGESVFGASYLEEQNAEESSRDHNHTGRSRIQQRRQVLLQSAAMCG